MGSSAFTPGTGTDGIHGIPQGAYSSGCGRAWRRIAGRHRRRRRFCASGWIRRGTCKESELAGPCRSEWDGYGCGSCKACVESPRGFTKAVSFWSGSTRVQLISAEYTLSGSEWKLESETVHAEQAIPSSSQRQYRKCTPAAADASRRPDAVAVTIGLARGGHLRRIHGRTECHA